MHYIVTYTVQLTYIHKFFGGGVMEVELSGGGSKSKGGDCLPLFPPLPIYGSRAFSSSGNFFCPWQFFLSAAKVFVQDQFFLSRQFELDENFCQGNSFRPDQFKLSKTFAKAIFFIQNLLGI